MADTSCCAYIACDVDVCAALYQSFDDCSVRRKVNDRRTGSLIETKNTHTRTTAHTHTAR